MKTKYMWDTIKQNPELSIFAATTVGALGGVLMKQYLKVWSHSREIKNLWEKHSEDITAIKAHHDETVKIIFSEIDELKEVSQTTNEQVMTKLDQLVDKVCIIGEGLARVEGWINGRNSKDC